MRITLITTGGTIDGLDSDNGVLRTKSAAAEWLKKQPGIQIEEIAICNKDSTDVNSSDREEIISAIQQSDRFVLITHGTFTITDKAILRVGAWKPFGERNSDAEHQMAFALKLFLENPTPGVFIAMDDQLWDPDKAEKYEIENGKFRLRSIA